MSRKFSKLIIDKEKCVAKFEDDKIYKCEYNNNCYKECRSRSHSIVNDENNNSLNTTNNGDTIISYDNLNILESTINIIPNKDNYNNTQIYNMIIDNIIKGYSPKNEKSKIIEGIEKVIFQLTTSKNELELLKNNSSDNYNLSIIDLGEYEKILRQRYNIADEDFMIYLKQMNLTNRESEKNVQLEVYEPYNKTKLY